MFQPAMGTIRSRSRLVALALALGAAGSACSHPPPRLQPVQESVLDPEAQLGVDDVFEVRIAGEPDISGDFRVAADGSIDFPYVGRLTVVGLRSSDVQRGISDRLRDGKILVKPQVTVMVKEWNSRKVSI